MKVFISWSGAQSKSVAFSMRDWLPNVLHAVKPFVSSKDIHAGTRWRDEIAGELDETQFGLICVTKANQGEPWLNFEAGALAKSVDSSRVVPLAIDLSLADIKNPLGQFQGSLLTKEGLSEVVVSINACCDQSISTNRLEKSFEKWWPDLESELKEFAEQGQSEIGSTPTEHARDDRELLEEVLTTVRSLTRTSDEPTASLSLESAVSRVHATADPDEKAEILRPHVLKRAMELREEGETSFKWPQIASAFPSGVG
jgi:TIR domain